MFNGVPDPDDPSRSDLNAVYVTARKDGTVEIAKRTFDAPEGVGVAGPEFIWATILPRGGAVNERVAVALPLNPYPSVRTRMFAQTGRDHLVCSKPYDLPS